MTAFTGYIILTLCGILGTNGWWWDPREHEGAWRRSIARRLRKSDA